MIHSSSIKSFAGFVAGVGFMLLCFRVAWATFASSREETGVYGSTSPTRWIRSDPTKDCPWDLQHKARSRDSRHNGRPPSWQVCLWIRDEWQNKKNTPTTSNQIEPKSCFGDSNEDSKSKPHKLPLQNPNYERFWMFLMVHLCLLASSTAVATWSQHSSARNSSSLLLSKAGAKSGHRDDSR